MEENNKNLENNEHQVHLNKELVCVKCQEKAETESNLESSDYKERFMRTMADLQNFRNRVEQDKLNWSSATKIEVLRVLLPIIDDFYRASSSAPTFEQGSPANAWKNGILGVVKNIDKILKSLGVKEIDCKGSFDPKYHEALCKAPAEGQYHSGDIVQVLSRGYSLDGTVIRHAQVSVAD